MVSFTIKGPHTPLKHGETLCSRCRHSIIFKGEGQHDEVRKCSYFGEGMEIGFNVTECNEFDDKAKTSLRNMMEVAWLVETAGHGKSIGFVKPKSRTMKQDNEIRRLED